MKIELYEGDAVKVRTDLLALGIYQDRKRLEGEAAAVNKALGGALTEVIRDQDFKGELEKTLVLHTLGRIPAARVCLVGLGKEREYTLDRHRRVAARLVGTAKGVQAQSLTLPFFTRKSGDLSAPDLARAAGEGALLGAYVFQKYKKEKEQKPLRKFLLLTKRGAALSALRSGIRRGTLAAEAANFARDLVNEPGNVVTPISLAATARRIARSGGLSCRILNEKEAAKMGMGAYLGVAQGSRNAPRFIHLCYRPGGRGRKRSIALVGKGITFDSGGLSLKPSQSMTTMKMDKSGACTVLAVMQALPKLKPGLTVHGIIAAAENMPGGKAQRPDDIVRAMNGKTIEVLNTDAEGRLTLADALSYAAKLKPERIIDLATLTGACVVALGEFTAGVMGNDQSFIDAFLSRARETGEQMWPLPFDEFMKEKLKSQVADLKNIGNRWGGAITAGMFLQEFVGEIPWIHVDIAGPAFHEKGWAYHPAGATGIGVRTLLHYLSSL